jgi:GT2 family glycosyltransferase
VSKAHEGLGHVAVVLLNWNGWKDTCACIDSLLAQHYDNYSIVVVDNQSADDSEERIQRHIQAVQSTPDNVPVGLHKQILYIQAGENGGFAKGNNKGIQAALNYGADMVWVLNNDTEVDGEALAKAVTCLQADSKTGMCGSVLVYFDDRSRIQAVGGVEFFIRRARGEQIGEGLNPTSADLNAVASQHELTYIAGAALLVKAELLCDVGLMSEDYFLYFEEIDWCSRAVSKGWKLVTATDSFVFHKEGASIGTASRTRRSPLSQYYLSRNLIHFYRRFHPMLAPVAMTRVLRDAVLLTVSKETTLGKVTWRAFRDGLTGLKGKVTL